MVSFMLHQYIVVDKRWKKICRGMVDEIHSLGTPEHLEEYLGRNE